MQSLFRKRRRRGSTSLFRIRQRSSIFCLCRPPWLCISSLCAGVHTWCMSHNALGNCHIIARLDRGISLLKYASWRAVASKGCHGSQAFLCSHSAGSSNFKFKVPFLPLLRLGGVRRVKLWHTLHGH